MFKQFRPIHLIASLIIVGSFVLKGFGMDGVIDKLLLGVSAFFFGLNLPQPKDCSDGKNSTT